VEEILENRPARREVLFPIALFCLGFSSVFVILGATATALGQLVYQHQRVLEVTGGAVVTLLGLHQLGWIRFSFLQADKSVHLRKRPAHGLAAFVIGVAFAAGWTPCLGPILGSILAYAGTRETVSQGVTLLVLFSAGLSAPFLAVGLALGSVLPRFRQASRLMRWISMASGVLLVLMGILLLTDHMQFLYRLLS